MISATERKDWERMEDAKRERFRRVPGEKWVKHKKFGIVRAHWSSVNHVLCEIHPEEVLFKLPRKSLKTSPPPFNADSRPLCEWVDPPVYFDDHLQER